jgi:hypothetical protein
MLAIQFHGTVRRIYFNAGSLLFLYAVHGSDVESREASPAACGGGGISTYGGTSRPRLVPPTSRFEMRTPQANGTLQRARSSCVRWLARHCKSSAVSAMVSRLARIGFEVAYWLDRGTRPTSGGMHLALPPPRRPVQIAHVEQKRRVQSDSPAPCDGLALPAGQLVAGSGLCLSAQLHFQVRSKTWISLCNSRSDVPIARDWERDSVMRA